MPVTRAQIKAEVQNNLIELNYNFYSDMDLNNSIQDAYDDIVILTQCIQKQVTLPWISNLSYYKYKELDVHDYFGVIAIFNKVTNLWLRDDLSLKDFDRIRRDWENWIGTPQFWSPSDPDNIAICPKYFSSNLKYGAFDAGSFYEGAFAVDNSANNPLGEYILYYWTTAPKLNSDSDILLIASDKANAVEQYCTADLLEQAQEFNKAGVFWDLYNPNIVDYADRVKRINKSDLLLRL